MPTRHPSDALLLDYAAGSLSEGWGLAVATHLALCPACRSRVLAAEAVGGAMIDAIEPAPVAEDALAATLARIDADPDPAPRSAAPVRREASIFPEPLRSYIENGPGLAWRKLGPSAHTIIIPTGDRATTARLLRIPAGAAMPVHSHRGLELTLVLQGAFHDEGGTYARGDIEEADEEVEHQPIASPGEDCICLAVTDAPLKFRGVARLLQPFLGI
ncbi:MAG: cupin domain-containing protein [Bauldia sp.]|nr:cupin domain-containing protein [Bauldia sp.]